MSNKNDKVINVNSSVVVKKSPNLREVNYKANANLTEEEAIERHTIGKLENQEDENQEEA